MGTEWGAFKGRKSEEERAIVKERRDEGAGWSACRTIRNTLPSLPAKPPPDDFHPGAPTVKGLAPLFRANQDN